MEKANKCPKCDGEIEEGFMLDSGSYGTAMPQQQVWVEGKSLSFFGNGKQRKVTSIRCKNCGFLENFAV